MPMHYLLFYDLSPEYLEKRGAYRNDHLALAWKARDRGELVLAGALTDPTDHAVLLFQGESPEVAREFALSDPYVQHGLVTGWRVREWTTVVGDDAAAPVKPPTNE